MSKMDILKTSDNLIGGEANRRLFNDDVFSEPLLLTSCNAGMCPFSRQRGSEKSAPYLGNHDGGINWCAWHFSFIPVPQTGGDLNLEVCVWKTAMDGGEGLRYAIHERFRNKNGTKYTPRLLV